MGYTKRTTRSTGKGSRTTSTKTITNKGSTRNTVSRSSGSKTSRNTSSTNLNSGKPTKHYITRNVAGWRTTTLLNPTSKTKKPSKAKSYKIKKSKPMKLGTIGWAILVIAVLLLANS